MIEIPGYTITKIIHEDAKALVYEGSSKRTGLPVLIKALNSTNPDPKDIDKLKDNFLVSDKLNKIEGVLKIIDFVQFHKNCVLIFEHFNGKLLRDVIPSGVSALLFLQLAVRLSEILYHIHANDIVHCNIKPDVILLSDDYGKSTPIIKIAGIGGASFKLKDALNVALPNILDISLEYISPEQTGRMNRTVDYRTDFYSLGITFYEMLTGHVPFRSKDVMELIYFHLAKEPEEPSKINNKIPEVVSRIIMKLISKDPEERYQSALGLKADLEFCLKQYEMSGDIKEFDLGKKDYAGNLRMPKKLFGRDNEIKILLDIYNEISNGKSELAFISGFAGTGKTSLVNAIYMPVVKNKGYFISSKFENLIREIPYHAFIKAFKILIRQLLAEKDDEIGRWKNKILDAVSPNGKLLTDVIPELELIIGKQELLDNVGITEKQNRYNLYFQKFVRVFADQKHPLVLFLDDLQWADPASLNLIKVLITDPETRYLFIIGAYRENEINESHGLTKTINEIKNAGININNIYLKSLGEDNVYELISDIVQSQKDPLSLSSVIFKKTQGNPFFVIELLKTLYRDNLLGFTQNAGWVWDIEAINQTKATDNVIELLSSKFVRLPEQVQEKLKMCACLGSNFDIEILSELFNKTLVETAIEMSELVNEGFITFSGNYFKFIHDRVQEIIYSFIGDEEKNKLHFKIGKFVLKEISNKDIGENLFYVVNQLNFGSSLLTDQNDKNEVAELNLLAGRKAKESTAYVSAINYLQAGRSLLSGSSWENDYNLMYSIHRDLAECEYLNGNFTEAESIFDILLENAANKIDRANVYNIMVILYMNIGNYDKAIGAGIEGLRMFGIIIPDNPGKINILHELIRFKWNLRRIKLDETFLRQEMTDPDKLAALELLTNVGTPAFYSKPKLFVLVVLNIINYYFKYGNTSYASPSYIALGAILGGVFGDYDLGYEFGQFALLLNENIMIEDSIARYSSCLRILYSTGKNMQQTIFLISGGLTDSALNPAI